MIWVNNLEVDSWEMNGETWEVVSKELSGFIGVVGYENAHQDAVEMTSYGLVEAGGALESWEYLALGGDNLISPQVNINVGEKDIGAMNLDFEKNSHVATEWATYKMRFNVQSSVHLKFGQNGAIEDGTTTLTIRAYQSHSRTSSEMSSWARVSINGADPIYLRSEKAKVSGGQHIMMAAGQGHEANGAYVGGTQGIFSGNTSHFNLEFEGGWRNNQNNMSPTHHPALWPFPIKATSQTMINSGFTPSTPIKLH